jgi:hypothetical protein
MPIQVVENENGKFIPIKPICEILGIDHNGQKQRLKRDEILSSVECTIHATGADGKQYEMTCIPIMYIFGWLFTIDTNKVSEDAREAVVKYKLECYKALFNHFVSFAEFAEHKQNELNQQLEFVKLAKTDFNRAKNAMYEAENKLLQISRLTIEDWDLDRKQLKMEFNV